MAIFARIVGWGKYVPQKVLTNQELGPRVGTTDEEIRALTGIRERHIASDQETASSLAAQASRRALAQAGVDAESIELII
ncbi:MAG: 3-oxoacyl-ACP synthase, partial [Chloroflexota bacterium]|nr:3-oxoacyl-ACP synthase [Chloroflexota bacterium]